MILSLLLFLPTIISIPIAPRKIIYAVDCGGGRELKTSLGVTFSKDANFSQDTRDVDYYMEPELVKPHVRYTHDTHLYMTERHGEQDFEYAIPLTKNWDIPSSSQNYVLILKFGEFYFRESNRRTFNVGLGNCIVVHNLDVFNLVGFSTAYDEYIPLQYENGDIYFKGSKCQDAIRNNELIITFIKTEFDNPMVSALLLFNGTLEETDFEDREELKFLWNKRYHNMTREERKDVRQKKIENRKKDLEQKQSTIKVRPGHEHEIEEKMQQEEQDEEDAIQNPRRQLPPFSWELLKVLLMTPMGIVCMIGFFTSSFVLFAFTFFDPYGQKKLLREMEALIEANNLGRIKENTDDSSESSRTEDNSHDTQQLIEQREVQVEPEIKSKKSSKVKIQDSKKKD